MNNPYNQCCDTFFDIVVSPGGTYNYPLMFNSAPYTKIKNVVKFNLNTQIITETQHNLKKGDFVHIFISRQEINGCFGNEQNPLSLEVTGIIDNFTFTVNHFNDGGKIVGYIAKAIDLSGFRLEASIQNRLSTREINLTGVTVTGFIGTYDILVCGYTDFVIGDIITIENTVIEAKVLNVYKHLRPPVPDCYCEEVDPEEEPCDYEYENCVVLTVDKRNETDFLNLNRLSITGSKICNINHSIPYPKTGIVWISLLPSQTRQMGAGIAYDDDCPTNRVVFIGKYGIVLVRGYANNVPEHYCRQPSMEFCYDTDVINVASGDVYIRPIFSIYDKIY